MSENELREKLGQINSNIQKTQKEIDQLVEGQQRAEKERVASKELNRQIEEAQAILKSLEVKRDNIKGGPEG